jgi:ADP-ribose pyrophosphatase
LSATGLHGGRPIGAPAASGQDEHLIERRTGGRTLLAGGFLEVRCDDVLLPDGTPATREYIRHGGAVAVIPILDDGRVVLVRQYRHPVGKVLLEFPAGKRDADESQIACAMRELEEETGYTAREWAYAGEIHNAPAYSTESIWLWYARGLVAGAKRPDAGEFVETVLHTDTELDALDANGELPDVKTLIGLRWLQLCRSGQRAWTWQSADAAVAQAGAAGAAGL